MYISPTSKFCIDIVHGDRARIPTQLTRHSNIFTRVFLAPSTRRIHPTNPPLSFTPTPSLSGSYLPSFSSAFIPRFFCFSFLLFFLLFSFSLFSFFSFLSSPPSFSFCLLFSFCSFLSLSFPLFLFFCFSFFLFFPFPSLFSLPLFSLFPTAAQFYRQYPDRWGGGEGKEGKDVVFTD